MQYFEGWTHLINAWTVNTVLNTQCCLKSWKWNMLLLPIKLFFSLKMLNTPKRQKKKGKMIWKMRFLTLKLGGSPLGFQVTPSISGQTKRTYTSLKFKLYIYMCVGITWYHIIISHQFPNLYSHEAWPVAPTSCSTAWLPIQSPRPELESGRPSGKKQRGRKTWKNVGKIWKHIWKTAHYGEKNMANYGKTWRKMGRTRTARKLGKPYFFWNYISKTLGNGQTTIGNSEELFFFAPVYRSFFAHVIGWKSCGRRIW